MPEIGQRIRLSKGDIAQTMALYKCPSNIKHICFLIKQWKKLKKTFIFSLWPDFPNDKGFVRFSATGVGLHIVTRIGACEGIQTCKKFTVTKK